MPARREEIHHAKEEEVQFRLLCNPVRILDDGNGNVRAVECIEMQLGEPDASGRRRPEPVAGSEFLIEADTVIMALGTSPNPLLHRTTPGITVNRGAASLPMRPPWRQRRPESMPAAMQ